MVDASIVDNFHDLVIAILATTHHTINVTFPVEGDHQNGASDVVWERHTCDQIGVKSMLHSRCYFGSMCSSVEPLSLVHALGICPYGCDCLQGTQYV